MNAHEVMTVTRVPSLRRRLAIAVLLVALPLLALNAAWIGFQYTDAIDRKLVASMELAVGTASAVTQYLSANANMALALCMELDNEPAPHVPDVLTRYLQFWPAVRVIEWLDPSGRVIGATAEGGPSDLSALPHVQSVMAGSFRSVSNVVADRRTGLPAVEQVQGNWIEGRLIGMVVLTLDLSGFAVAVPTTRQGSGAFMLVDSREHIIYHSAHPDLTFEARRIAPDNPVRQALAGERAVSRGFESRVDGTLLLGSAVPVPETTWAVAFIESVGEVLAVPRLQAARGLVLLTGWVLFATWATWDFIDRLLRPARDLREAALAFARGDLDARVGMTAVSELADAARAFDYMAEHLKKLNEQTVADAELREKLLDMARALSSQLVPQEALSHLAREACTLLGAEMVGCWEVHQDKGVLRLGAIYPPAQGMGPRIGTEVSVNDPDAAVARVSRTRGAEIIHAVKSRGSGEISAALHAATGFEAAMVVAVGEGERIVGVLAIGDFHDPYRFNQHDLERAQLLAQTVAGALLRMQLHQTAQRQVQVLEALHEIHTAITSTLDLRVVLQAIVDRAMVHLRADAVSVLLSDRTTEGLVFAAGRGFLTRVISRRRLNLGEGIAGRAAQDGSSIFVGNLAGGEQLVRIELVKDEGFVSGAAVPLMVKGHLAGVLEVFHRQPFDHDDDWRGFAELLASQAAVAIDNAAMLRDVRQSHDRLAKAYDVTLAGWSRALDLRDRETEGHSERVAEMAVQLARRLGLDGDELTHVRRGALLHDIGKLGVPDAILQKPGPLDAAERAIMNSHTVHAYEMLAPVEYLRPAMDIPYCHHEKWDGTGYPRGLQGEHIPLAARLFAVVDVWDALRSDRPYRRAWTDSDALDYIQTRSGSHFDPMVVRAFGEMLDELGPKGNEQE